MKDFREIAKGTSYEFDKYNLLSNDKKLNNIDSEWLDKSNNKYKLIGKYLFVTSYDEFTSNGYSIVDYINDIPSNLDITVVLSITSDNNLESYNNLFELLNTNINKKVIVNITNLKLNQNSTLNINSLNSNIKITSMLDNNLKENYLVSNELFESWMLNLDDEKFNKILGSLTNITSARIKRLREIASNFYRRTPMQVKNSKNLEKAIYAYKWSGANITYDMQAHNIDGTVKQDRLDSTDPICTVEHRKGSAEGRAKLYKLVLNNYYMKVPCFLVKGTSANLEHTWNEVLMEDDTTVEFDLSNKENKISINHDDLDNYLSNEGNTKVKTLKNYNM